MVRLSFQSSKEKRNLFEMFRHTNRQTRRTVFRKLQQILKQEKAQSKDSVSLTECDSLHQGHHP